MKMFWKRMVVNRSYCCKFAVKWTGAVFTLWGMVSLFFSTDGLIDSQLAWWIRLLYAVLLIAVVFFFFYIIGTVVVFKVNKIDLLDVGNNHHVYVQYGDALSENILNRDAASKKRNIVVSVNRCFDTIVDDNLISVNSLHGQAMKSLYDSGQYTVSSLDKKIQQKLKNFPYELVNNSDKPKGNLKRYGEGSVAEIDLGTDIVYFFVGLTSFDRMLHPYISDVEYGVAIVKALQYCIDRNQGYPVILPLLGGGRAQTHKEEKDILEFFIKLIQLNKLSINCDIHIVVRESAKGSISILKLKQETDA